MKEDLKIPRFLLIKQYLKEHILSGTWPEGTAVPSENELAQRFLVSRMTARRALKELDDLGLLVRKPGLGSFVAKRKMSPAMVEVIDVVTGIRGQQAYRVEVLNQGMTIAEEMIEKHMGVNSNQELYYAVFRHSLSERPVQLQRLYVNSRLAPAFLKQDFNKVSAQDYLAWISPPSRTECNISAIVASEHQRDILAFEGDNDGACLQVVTRQWCGEQLLSFSIALNPSADYHLGYDVMAPAKGKSRLTNP